MNQLVQGSKEIAVIGDGIAGRLTVFYLIGELKLRQIDNVKIVHIRSNLFPPCSRNSAAVAALRMTSKNLSVYGDKIVEGFEELERFIKKFSPPGIYEGSLKTLSSPTQSGWEDFKKRYRPIEESKEIEDYYEYKEKAYFFNPDIFLEWLASEYRDDSHYSEIDDQVLDLKTSAEGALVLTQSRGELLFTSAVCAMGAYSLLLPTLANDQYLKRTMPVAGTFLEFNNIDCPLKSFNVTVHEKSLIYRHEDQTLILGAVSEDGFWQVCDPGELKDLYQLFKELNILPLPPYKKAQVKTGIRHKGPRRVPFGGRLNGNIWGMLGFYKNGYQVGFSEAKKLTKDLLA